ncbi:hypothetical protein VTN31DRAFT_2502 [Thermomyces dupontii]|uniref:uncharacterized protein n=1 Tax=Talaromyces thermophilus TaxID=28565 RepID=UPI003743A8D0
MRAVAVVQIFIPLALGVVLVGALKEDNTGATTTSAVSWSVIGRFLHASRWPTLLAADSASIPGVPWHIVLVTRLKPILVSLTAVAAVVTPLGLYQTIVEEDEWTENVPFHYIEDPSGFGLETVRFNFSDIGPLCSETNYNDVANLDNFAAACGLVYGTPKRADGKQSSPGVSEPGSDWSVPLYSCIMTAKATIKRVTFRFNGTDDLSGIKITEINNKVYPDEGSKPLWGVERSEKRLVDVDPLWGLISSPYQGNISLYILRQESLYLPGREGSLFTPLGGYEYLPGADFYSKGLTTVFKLKGGNRLYWDDYLILVALLFKYGCSIGVAILMRNGLGSHIDLIPEKNVQTFLQINWSNTFVYSGCICFIKLSILALYKRLFAVTSMGIAIKAMAAFVILWTVSLYIINGFLCIPVNRFWDSTVEGACVDMAKFYYGQQIPNIISDFVILVMPMKIIWELPITKVQTALLSGIFLIGGLTLIFDIFRLVAMIRLTKVGPDVTYNEVPAAFWTCLEAAVGIVAACLPNFRPLVRLGSRGFWSQLRSVSQRSRFSQLTTAAKTHWSEDTSTSFDMAAYKKRIESLTPSGTTDHHLHESSVWVIDDGRTGCAINGIEITSKKNFPEKGDAQV